MRCQPNLQQSLPLPDGVFPNAAYHGSYVAAGVWANAPGGPIALASVHASPQYADPVKYGWVGEVPEARHGGGDPRWPADRMWDSDLVAASLISISRHLPLLAGGDFNESRLDDPAELEDRHKGWGHDLLRPPVPAGHRGLLADRWAGGPSDQGEAPT